MKRRILAAVLTLVLALTLVACGSSGGGGTSTMQTSNSSAIDGYAEDYNMDATGWEGPSEEMEALTAGGESGGVPSSVKMIYTADLSLETKTFDTAVAALDQIVEELGAYYESRSLGLGGSYHTLDCTIRVPVEQFQQLLDQAGQAAHVRDRTEYSDDVSESYYDLEARLTTQRTKLERLQTLLSQAESMSDIITIESAISDTELQIEYLTGSLQHYDSRISYSTVNIYLREVYRLSSDQEPPATFGERLGAAFATGWERGVQGLEDFVVALAANWATLLVLLAVAAAVVTVVRRLRRRKRMPPPPAGGEPPTEK